MSGVYRKERGESRAIYTAIKDDPDFIALSKEAKLLWYTLKMELGASGIAVVYPGALADLTGIEYPAIAPTLAELEAGNWIRRERNVVWLRNGLRFDPYLSTANRLHLAAICKHLSGLPKLAIVNDFCAYYKVDPAWITAGVPESLTAPAPETLSETLPERDTDTGSRIEDRGERNQEVGGGELELQASSTESAREKNAVDRSDVVDGLDSLAAEYPLAIEVLNRLKHKGGKGTTKATIRSRILFPEGQAQFADPTLAKIPLSERVRILAAALLEYEDQGGKDWSSRAIVGYMGRLHRTRGEQEREEQKRSADASQSKAAERAAARAAIDAELEAKKRALEREAVERGFVTPEGDASALIRSVASAKALRLGGSTA